MEKIDKKLQGKKSRAAGQRFELRVRLDLEQKGWVVAKWTNNVEKIDVSDEIRKQITEGVHEANCEVVGKIEVEPGYIRRLVKVKNKFLGPGRPMMLGAGFPDFIIFKLIIRKDSTRIGFDIVGENLYEIVGVESKMNGELDKQEKEKCNWLLKNNIFSKILIASKGTKKGQIVYKEFK